MLQASRAPRSRRRDYEDSRRRLLAAARLILAERGPEALTVSEVAQRAGLNRSTAYQHFRTRDALASAVTAEVAEELTDELLGSRALWGQIDQMSLFFVDHPELARLVVQQLLSESPLPERAWSSYLGQIRKIARSRDAQPGIDAEMLSHLLICVGILWPLLARAHYENATSVRRATRRMGRELRRLLLYGVLRPDARQDVAEAGEPPGSGAGTITARGLRAEATRLRPRRRRPRGRG
jgi:AcrR family transcriptional regulator